MNICPAVGSCSYQGQLRPRVTIQRGVADKDRKMPLKRLAAGRV